MAKNKAKAPAATTVASTSKRAGYKRKKNGRVDVLGDQLKSIARAALNKAKYDKTSSIS